MARIGGQVAIAATEDGVALVKKELIVDPESGLLLEVENVKIAVDVGGGNIVVKEEQRIKGIHVPSAAIGAQSGRRAIEPRRPQPPPPSRPRPSEPSRSRNSSSCAIQ